MKRYVLIFALLAILIFTTVSALAQDDATPTDTDVPAETQEATAAATEEAIATQDVIIIVTQTPEQSPTPTLTPTPEMTATATGGGGDDGSTGGGSVSGGSVLLVVIGVLMVFSAGGNLVTMIANFRKDRAATAATEQLGNSIPAPVGDRLLNTIDTLTGLLGIARESLDRVPAASKPPETPVLAQFTTAELNAELARRAAG